MKYILIIGMCLLSGCTQTQLRRFSEAFPASPEGPEMQMRQEPHEGIPVYQAKDCIGAVIMGKCHGSIVPTRPPLKCYGAMLDGQCTGPLF